MRNMNLTPRPRDLTALLNGGRPETVNTEKPESAGEWVKTSVSLRASTRRRLKLFAAEHDQRIQEVIDAALEAYLG